MGICDKFEASPFTSTLMLIFWSGDDAVCNRYLNFFSRLKSKKTIYNTLNLGVEGGCVENMKAMLAR